MFLLLLPQYIINELNKNGQKFHFPYLSDLSYFRRFYETSREKLKLL